MRRAWAFVAGGAVILVVVLAATGYLGGWLGGAGDPECGELPSRVKAQRALDDHADLVRKLSEVGAGVEVSISTPCPQPDAALVVVRVADASEESRARELLSEGDGLGVPAVVHQR